VEKPKGKRNQTIPILRSYGGWVLKIGKLVVDRGLGEVTGRGEPIGSLSDLPISGNLTSDPVRP